MRKLETTTSKGDWNIFWMASGPLSAQSMIQSPFIRPSILRSRANSSGLLSTQRIRFMFSGAGDLTKPRARNALPEQEQCRGALQDVGHRSYLLDAKAVAHI